MSVRLSVPVLAILLGCGGTSPEPAKPTPVTTPTDRAEGEDDRDVAPAVDAAQVGVALDITPPDAVVEIDEIALGPASQLDPVFALAPGLHTLVVSHPDYKTYRVEFSITDKTETFVIRLDPRTPSR